jgi:hypothetical protein
MPSKLNPRFALVFALVPALWFAGQVRASGASSSADTRATVSVGLANADVVGDDNLAIQKAVDRVAAAGGGTVRIKAGTYTLRNSVRLASHVTLEGESEDKVVLKKAVGVKSPLKLDADYGELIATVEDARGFALGMGVTIVDKEQRAGWTPSVRTITRLDGATLHFDRFLHMDYTVANAGEVFNTFPLVSGYDVEDVRVAHLTADGSGADGEILDGCQSGAIYFFHSRRIRIENVVARNYPGDGISTQFVEDPAIDNSQAYGNADLGIHLGTGALRGIVRHNRAHDNGEDGIYLCWRVQHGVFEDNESWANGRDGISVGHKDTDNLFVRNVAKGNARWGVYLRQEPERNAPHRNTFRANLIENNGPTGEPGYQVRIEGETTAVTFESNTIRDTREANPSRARVGIYIGPQASHITCEGNTFVGRFDPRILDESKNSHNNLGESAGR